MTRDEGRFRKSEAKKVRRLEGENGDLRPSAVGGLKKSMEDGRSLRYDLAD